MEVLAGGDCTLRYGKSQHLVSSICCLHSRNALRHVNQAISDLCCSRSEVCFHVTTKQCKACIFKQQAPAVAAPPVALLSRALSHTDTCSSPGHVENSSDQHQL